MIHKYRGISIGSLADAVRIPKAKPHFGHVYAVFFSDGLVKIGKTTNLGQRVRAIATEVSPFGLTVTGVAWTRPATNYGASEVAMHRQFLDHRVGREFFRVERRSILSAMRELSIRDDASEIESQLEGSAHRMLDYFVHQCRPGGPLEGDCIGSGTTYEEAFILWCQEEASPDLKLDRAFQGYLDRGMSPEAAEERMLDILRETARH